MKNKGTILIVGEVFGFPNGYGASARVRVYAKGLVRIGYKVLVVCLKASEPFGTPPVNRDTIGNHQGVDFIYTTNHTQYSDSFLKRRSLEIKGIINFIRLVNKLNKKEKIIAIIGYSSGLVWISFILIATKIYDIKMILELCELPFVYYRKGLLKDIKKVIFERVFCRFFDGFITISKYLEKYIINFKNKEAIVLHVPILVEIERFNGKKRFKIKSGIITYIGDLNRFEEVTGLIEAFNHVASTIKGIRLRLIGDTYSDMMKNSYRKLVNDLKQTKMIEFLGKVQENEIPMILKSSDVLVLPRVKAQFSDAGFPTKLGEYLASGRPVVATETGEITDFLVDGRNAYLVESNQPDVFADRLKYALDHPGLSNKIGQRGRNVAKKYFDIGIHSPRISEMIEQLSLIR